MIVHVTLQVATETVLFITEDGVRRRKFRPGIASLLRLCRVCEALPGRVILCPYGWVWERDAQDV